MNHSESSTMTPMRRCGSCVSFDDGLCLNLVRFTGLDRIPAEFEGCQDHETPEESQRDINALTRFRVRIGLPPESSFTAAAGDES